MGLNTGLVVVGKIGDNLRMDYTAVGDTTHVAARLQNMAAPGELLIADTTFEQAQALVEARPLGPIQIKGRSAPLAVHSLIGPRAAGAPARSARVLSRFVGREREMADLMDCLEHAEAARGQAIGIVSDPGMGKTRLLWEFRQRIAQRDVGYIEGQCLSYGTAMPYLPIIDIVRTACRIAESDTPAAVLDKVRTAVAAIGVDVDVDGAIPVARARPHAGPRRAGLDDARDDPGAHLRSPAPVVPEEQPPQATGVRDRRSPLGRPHVRGFHRRDGRQPRGRVDPADLHLPPRLLAGLDQQVVRDPDRVAAAVAKRRSHDRSGAAGQSGHGAGDGARNRHPRRG